MRKLENTQLLFLLPAMKLFSVLLTHMREIYFVEAICDVCLTIFYCYQGSIPEYNTKLR